jgi:hypothetical protein
MSTIRYWEEITVIMGFIFGTITIIYKSLRYLYCKGKDAQNDSDEIKNLKIRLEYVETELNNLQIDISKYNLEFVKKLDQIKADQADMKTDISVIKAILGRNFPSI